MDRVHIPPISTRTPAAGTRVEGRSDVGRSRDENQDYMGVFHVGDRVLAVVADGMGGHSGGYEASRIAVDAMREAFVANPAEAPDEVLLRGIQGAQSKIRLVGEASPDLQGMGTTLVAALVTKGRAWIGHVGDSRAYHLRGGRLVQLTLDHSRVNRMLLEGIISADQVADHPMGHILERTVGASDKVDPEIRADAVPLQAGDRLLLCSDGVWSVVEDAELADCAATADLALATEEALGLALVRGTDDNATLVSVEVSDGPASAPEVADVRTHRHEAPGANGSATARAFWPAVVGAFVIGAVLGTAPSWLSAGSTDEPSRDERVDEPSPREGQKARDREPPPATAPPRPRGRRVIDKVDELSERVRDIVAPRPGAPLDGRRAEVDHDAVLEQLDPLLDSALELFAPEPEPAPAAPAAGPAPAAAVPAPAAPVDETDPAGTAAADDSEAALADDTDPATAPTTP